MDDTNLEGRRRGQSARASWRDLAPPWRTTFGNRRFPDALGNTCPSRTNLFGCRSRPSTGLGAGWQPPCGRPKRGADRNAALIAEGNEDRVRERVYTGKPTYYDQIWTSIKTVFFGFLIASVVAIPLGIAAGLSVTANAALNPLIQIFKPVSPLAWLPIVTMIVSAVYTTNDGLFSKSFLISAITVTLCSLWPTLINTALGVSSIDKDLVSVSRVLKMNTYTKITKLVLPSALPLIFTGLRLSLGVGWMVLIAAEMLAQNPGLGKFVWDEFQNGSSQSLAKIMVAVFTIGSIGFLLDRVMYALQSMFTFSNNR